MKPRIMYVESKADGLFGGDARIGRVSFSKTGRTLYYRELAFQSVGGGYKSNFVELESGDPYWISGPRRHGADRLYGERRPVPIDEDVRVEYWTDIRRRPDLVAQRDARLSVRAPRR